MAKEDVKKNSLIQIKVGLNDENTPVHMEWQAQDNPQGDAAQDCKAMLLSLFDPNSKETLRIDLWTNEMQVVEMDRFVFQTLKGLADSYFKATQNAELANDFQRFARYFGEQTEIIPKESEQ